MYNYNRYFKMLNCRVKISVILKRFTIVQIEIKTKYNESAYCVMRNFRMIKKNLNKSAG